MTTTKSDEHVKLQIPVSADLAERVAHVAKRFDRSQAWLVAMLLEMAIEQREKLGDWICALLMGKVNRVVRALGNSPVHNPQIVRLQVPVSKANLDDIAELGEKLGHTPVRMAGLLVEWMIDGHELIMYAASTEIAKKAGRLIFAKPNDQTQPPEAIAADALPTTCNT